MAKKKMPPKPVKSMPKADMKDAAKPMKARGSGKAGKKGAC